MSSSRFRSSPAPLALRLPPRRRPSRLAEALVGAAFASLLAAPALAQATLPQVQPRPVGSPPIPSPMSPGMPSAMPPRGGMAKPIGMPPGTTPFQPRQEQQQQATMPAKLPDQPAGGFGTMQPEPGREDPAMRMGLRNADEYVRKMGDNSDSALKNNLDGALPSATIPNESDLVSLQKVQRDMQLLDAKERLAEIAVKYWGTVFNNQNAKEYREVEAKQKKEEADDRKRMQEAEEKRQAAAAQQEAMAAQAKSMQQQQRPPVAQASQARVFDVMGNEARLMWPGGGVVVVRPGDTLPDGSRVASVGTSGVMAIDPSGHRMPVMMADAQQRPSK